jgi:putative Holliday junction resolvase
MPSNVIALDVGEQRVGVAIAREGLSVALPLVTLGRTAANFWIELLQIVKQNNISKIVVGLPRGLDGQETAQTMAARTFGDQLKQQTELPIIWQDEAVTSVQAEALLKQQGKPYGKGDIDAVAASLILQDYLNSQKVTS